MINIVPFFVGSPIHKKIIIVGGGASAYFLAANLDISNKNQVLILEKAQEPLQKVKISGGGRCNVTHACFEVEQLTKNYPRGGKALKSVFNNFQPKDTIDWFESRGVKLKKEKDGRMFPESNKSESIINILRNEAEKIAEPIFGCNVTSIKKKDNGFVLETTDKNYSCDALVIATGSNRHIWQQLENLGHTVTPPIPSLFSFNIKDKALNDLMGTSFIKASLEIPNLKLKSSAPLMITHWGLSGPAALIMSAFGARKLAEVDYKTEINVNWVYENEENCYQYLMQHKKENASFSLDKKRPYELNKRFWDYILQKSGIYNADWQYLGKQELRGVSRALTKSIYDMNGKSTNKDEFVTAGGVKIKEIDFRTMQSKIVSNLFVIGEALDIDAVTGGFNFQACWSEAFLLSKYFSTV